MDENTENIEATENAEDINIAAKALEDIKGHDKIVIEDEETGTVYSGAMLMNAGLNLTRDVYEDGTSVTKHFKAVK